MDSIQKQLRTEDALKVEIDATRKTGENLLRTTFEAILSENDTLQKEFVADDSVQKEW